jgi:recombination protein RecT
MSNANAKLAAALKPGQIVKMTGAEAGMGNVKSFMESQKANLAAVLPKHVDADRMLKLALGAMRTTPKLLNCNVESLMGAVVTCSTLGLEPNTPLGHAYLIPFENRQKGTTDVQIVFGYKGLIDLARRSGQIVSIAAHEVCQNDEFHFSYGLDEKLIHKPALTGRGEPIAFYAVAKLVGGGYAFEVMGRDQIEEIRDASQNYKFAREKGKTVWGQHFVEMGRKTVLRRLFKYLPVSIELATAANIDSNTEAGKAGNYEEALKGEYSVMPDDAPAALPEGLNQETGEWTPPASSNWQPSEAELAEIKQREMAEAGDLLGDVPQ